MTICYYIGIKIHSRVTKKAPEVDFMSPELFKDNLDWWAALVIGLFTHINNAGREV